MKLIKHINKKLIVIYMVLALLMAFDNLILPMTVENIIKVTESSNIDKLIFTVAVSVVLWSLSKIVKYFYDVAKYSVSRDYQLTIKSKLYNIYMNSLITPENFQNMIYRDINMIEESYLNSIFSIIVSIFLSSISLIYMFQLDFNLSIVFIVMALIPVLLSGVFDKKIIALGEKASRDNEMYIKDINENIKGLSIINHYKRNTFFKNKNLEALNILEKSNFDKKEVLSRAVLFIMIIYGFSYIIPIGYGAYRIIQGKSTVAALMGIYLIADKAISPLTGIITYFNSMKSVQTIKNKVVDLLDKSDEIEHLEEEKEIEIEKITFKNANIGYNKPLFSIDDDINKNDKILLIGKSGSGKSSLFKTIFRDIDLLSGDIKINDESIKNYTKQSLYKNIGYIPQDIIIFDESVEFNITLGEDFSKEKIKEALIKSGFRNYNLDEFIIKNAGDSGNELSGGEKARICIARAIIRNYDILFIDEFSASLDKDISREIRNILMNMPITIIEIAHHYDNEDLELFDKVYEIKNGKLIVQ